jgi:hypothetical protein
MIALIRKELREIVWVPLGFLALVAAVTVVPHARGWWGSSAASAMTGPGLGRA